MDSLEYAGKPAFLQGNVDRFEALACQFLASPPHFIGFYWRKIKGECG